MILTRVLAEYKYSCKQFKSLKRLSPTTGFLQLTQTGEYTIALQDALLVCTIDLPWLNHTIGVFNYLNVEGIMIQNTL